MFIRAPADIHNHTSVRHSPLVGVFFFWPRRAPNKVQAQGLRAQLSASFGNPYGQDLRSLGFHK